MFSPLLYVWLGLARKRAIVSPQTVVFFFRESSWLMTQHELVNQNSGQCPCGVWERAFLRTCTKAFNSLDTYDGEVSSVPPPFLDQDVVPFGSVDVAGPSTKCRGVAAPVPLRRNLPGCGA